MGSCYVMPDNYYESNQVLQEYLLFHYGKPEELMPWSFGPKSGLDFPRRCLEEGLLADQLPKPARGLDLGCAVGRSTFEMARHCQQVVGIDYSHSFVLTARTLCREKSLPYEYVDTGSIMKPALASRPDVDCSGVTFEQGDAQDLRPDLGKFDLVLLANLLCRLPRPMSLLQRLPTLINPGGQLIITTPHTWLPSFTSPDFWIGAKPETGQTLEVLEQILSPDFKQVIVKDLPFLIREHSRKFQWSVAQLSTWVRR